jgi:bifunctional non-homologous end joining protein LigD
MPTLFSEHLTGDGQEMFEHAAKLGWEGIISKQADAPYRSERTEAWQKIKIVMKRKFPVIGFIKDPTGAAALYLGKREGKRVGLHGQGRDRVELHDVQPNPQGARHRRESKSKLSKPHKKPKATWLEPVFMADIEYRDITSVGLLRQSSFKGLKRN